MESRKKIVVWPAADSLLLLLSGASTRLGFAASFSRRACPAAKRACRRGARAADWAGLENRCAGNCTEGSNPSLSAAFLGDLSFARLTGVKHCARITGP